MQSFVMLSVIMLYAGVRMLSVVMLSFVMLKVVGPTSKCTFVVKETNKIGCFSMASLFNLV
jgi:hypothetical protein